MPACCAHQQRPVRPCHATPLSTGSTYHQEVISCICQQRHSSDVGSFEWSSYQFENIKKRGSFVDGACMLCYALQCHRRLFPDGHCGRSHAAKASKLLGSPLYLVLCCMSVLNRSSLAGVTVSREQSELGRTHNGLRSPIELVLYCPRNSPRTSGLLQQRVTFVPFLFVCISCANKGHSVTVLLFGGPRGTAP